LQNLQESSRLSNAGMASSNLRSWLFEIGA
jgi:hypothetical protein